MEVLGWVGGVLVVGVWREKMVEHQAIGPKVFQRDKHLRLLEGSWACCPGQRRASWRNLSASRLVLKGVEIRL